MGDPNWGVWDYPYYNGDGEVGDAGPDVGPEPLDEYIGYEDEKLSGVAGGGQDARGRQVGGIATHLDPEGTPGGAQLGGEGAG